MRTAVLLGVAVLLAIPASAPAEPNGAGLQRRKVLTPDGTALALYRYVPEGGGGSHPPVLLVPELGFGRELYDPGDRGLARFLQTRGRDVFVLEPRGQGLSAAPPGWRLRELVSQDLPAAIAAIAGVRTGPVDLVVHGYSGGLALAACARELQGRVRRVVALSPAVLPEVPNPTVAALLKSGGALSRLANAPDRAADFDLLFTRGGSFPGGGLFHGGPVQMVRAGVRDLSRAAAADLLAWMEQGDLPLEDGSTVKARLARYDRPTLLLLPLQDNLAHPEFASPLREFAPAAKVTAKVLSRASFLSEDYTHLSMLLGREAPREIFTPALGFLDEPEPEAPGVQRAAGEVH